MKLSSVGSSVPAGTPNAPGYGDDSKDGSSFNSVLGDLDSSAPETSATSQAAGKAPAESGGAVALPTGRCATRLETLPGQTGEPAINLGLPRQAAMPVSSVSAEGSGATGANSGPAANAGTGSSVDLTALANLAAGASATTDETGMKAPAGAVALDGAVALASASKGSSSDVLSTPGVGKSDRRRADSLGNGGDSGDPLAVAGNAVAVPPAMASALPPSGSAQTAPPAPWVSPPDFAATAVEGGLPKPGGIVGPRTSSAASTPADPVIDSWIEPGTVQVATHLGFSRGLDAARGDAAFAGGNADKAAPGAPVVAGVSALDPDSPTPQGVPAPMGADGKATDRHAAQSESSMPVSATAADAGAAVQGQVSSPVVAPWIGRVAEGIAALAPAPSPSAPIVPDDSTLQVAPAKTMNLVLSPAGLGTLSVRLHVSDRALDVHLVASDARTAMLIDRDRSALSDALNGRNYQVQSLTVTSHDATMQGATHAERGTDSGSANAGTSDRQGGAPDGDRAGRDAGRGDRNGASRRSTEDGLALDRSGSALFV